MASELAIIIPAYRERFFGEALTSLAQQTDQRFHLYVFDDCSEEDLKAVYDSIFGVSKNSSYFRFPANLGRESLAQHWNRCVRSTHGEPWVWLFSDDDVADPDCVSAFYRELENEIPAHVYRFNTMRIDSAGQVIAIHPPHPREERAELFAYHRLTGQRKSFVSEYLFNRDVFNKHDGFVAFPYALGSDDASWITFTEDLPIRTISGTNVYWRQSDQNVSRVAGIESHKKYLALADYAAWLESHLTRIHLGSRNDVMSSTVAVRDLAIPWLRNNIGISADFRISSLYDLATGLSERGFGSRRKWLLRFAVALMRAHFWRGMRWLRRLSKPLGT
jgi:glycosyltransferase involved in cell wall biosynthesis